MNLLHKQERFVEVMIIRQQGLKSHLVTVLNRPKAACGAGDQFDVIRETNPQRILPEII